MKPTPIVFWIIAIFAAIAYHHAYGTALDMIDNPHLEGFK